MFKLIKFNLKIIFLLLIYLWISGCASIEAQKYFHKGNTLIGQLNYEDALQAYNQAKILYQREENKEALAKVLTHIAIVELKLNQFDDALKHSKQSLHISQENSLKKIEANSLGNIGLSYYYLGQLKNAIFYLKKTLSIYYKFKDQEKISRVFSYMGLAYLHFGQLNNAIISNKNAQELFPKGASIYAQIEILNNLGLTYKELGKLQKSLNYFKQAKQLLTGQKRENSSYYATILTNIGTIYQERGSFANLTLPQQNANLLKAKSNYEAALRIEKKIGNKRIIAVLQNNLGLISKKLDDDLKKVVLPHYERALQLHMQIKNQRGEGYVLGNIGSVYKELGKFKKALYYYNQQFNLATKREFQPVLIEANYGIGGVLEKQGKLAEASIRYKIAIEIIENIRSDLDKNYHRTSFVENKLSIYKDIVLLLLRLGKYEEALYYTEKARSRTFLDMLKGIRKSIKNSDYEVLKQNKPSHPSDLQKKLPNDVAVLEYFVTDNYIVVWVITNNNIKVEKIFRNKKGILSTNNQILINAEKFANPLLIHDSENTSKLFYKSLIAPIKRYLKGYNKLVIIPHGVLHYLPFHVFKDNKYLLEEFEISYAPSYSILNYLLNQHNPKKPLLVVGNPDGSLKHAKDEAIKIHKLFPNSDLLIETNATEQQIKKIASNYGILHFATHGVLDRTNPVLSHIVLTPDGHEDGKLQVSEILGMELKAEIITLSACKTKSGKLTNGDEIIGLTRAFFKAGTDSLVVSLWDVVDNKYTVSLMTKFYNNLKNASLTKSGALRKAQLNLIQSNPNIPIYSWSPFVMIGDYQ